MENRGGEDLIQASASAVCLLCRVGSLICALPLQHVSETMRPLAIEPLAGMPSFVLGLSVVRGTPVPVVDAALLLGGALPSRPGRFVSVRVGARGVVLAVDAVLGVRALARDSLEMVPPLLGDSSSEVVEAMGTLDSDVMLVLRSGRIVPPSAWATLQAAGES